MELQIMGKGKKNRKIVEEKKNKMNFFNVKGIIRKLNEKNKQKKKNLKLMWLIFPFNQLYDH